MSASSLPSPQKCDTWFIDLGATQHMCVNQAAFTNYINKMFTIHLGDSTLALVKGQRHVIIQLQRSTKVTFTNVLYIPSLLTNLFSVSALFNKGCKVHFKKERYFIYWPNESHLATGIQEGNFFVYLLQATL